MLNTVSQLVSTLPYYYYERKLVEVKKERRRNEKEKKEEEEKNFLLLFPELPIAFYFSFVCLACGGG